MELSHIRTISLIRCIYKLLAKVLAHRLKEAKGDIISKSQGAFVKNRQILDKVMEANKLIHLRKNARKLRLLFNIDMEKGLQFCGLEFC